MHRGLSICQNKYCKTTFFALPCLVYLYSIVQQGTELHYYIRSCKKNVSTSESQLNLQKHIKVCSNLKYQ